MKLSLVSDGTSAGTYVCDEHGNPVEGITSVMLSVQPGEAPKAAFTMDMVAFRVDKADGVDVSRPRLTQGYELMAIRSMVPVIRQDTALHEDERSVLAEAHKGMLTFDCDFSNDYYYAPALIHMLKTALIQAIAQSTGLLAQEEGSSKMRVTEESVFDLLVRDVMSVWDEDIKALGGASMKLVQHENL